MNATTKNIKIIFFFDIIEISKSMEPNKCTLKKKMKIFIYVWFFKVQWVKKNQGVTFLMVPPKDGFAWLCKLNFGNALD
jgi:hypothetical protein